MTYRFQQYINGKWQDAINGATWSVINPATEEIIAKVPYGTGDDCHLAIEAAHLAFPKWSKMTAYDRGAILQHAAQLIRDRLDELYPILSHESGKIAPSAKGDWLGAASLFEWFAEEGKRVYGRTIPARRTDKRQIVIEQPIGVVGAITAWNFPAYNPVRSWAAALAAGCTVVGRPSELTPMSAMAIAGILEEAGLPPGVLNVICGDPHSMGQAMLEHPACKKVAFTGSLRVGKLLMEGAARQVTRLSLELGGNAPALIFPDVDLERAAKSAVTAKFRNCGQVCVAPQRFLVHESIYSEFANIVVRRISDLHVGLPLDDRTNIGPLINSRQRKRVEVMIEESVACGARLIAGGGRPAGISKGFFLNPTLLVDVNPDCSAFKEEIFGPLMIITSFHTKEEAITLANQTDAGLAAYVWTNDLRTATHCSELLEFGMVGVNTFSATAIEGPFSGWKQSGIGCECGTEGIQDYLQSKLINLSV